MKLKTLILLIILLAGIVIGFFSLRPPYSPKISSIGSPVPDFQLVDINNNKISLSDMKGSVILINFWATWCTSCIEEMPSLERLFRNFSGNSQFKILTILYKDDALRATGFMKQNGYTLPVYLNPDESAAKNFGITGVPETFIIDKKGILRDKVIGPAEWDSSNSVHVFQSLMNEP